MDKKQSPVTDRIQTLEDAYRERGYNRDELIIPDPKHPLQKAANSLIDAFVLTEALNEGWEPNYDDNEEKWEILWDMRSKAASGSGFSFRAFACADSCSFVGSRLVFRFKELAECAAKKFPEVFRGFIKRDSATTA